jgi:hypothetical protein
MNKGVESRRDLRFMAVRETALAVKPGLHRCDEKGYQIRALSKGKGLRRSTEAPGNVRAMKELKGGSERSETECDLLETLGDPVGKKRCKGLWQGRKVLQGRGDPGVPLPGMTGEIIGQDLRAVLVALVRGKGLAEIEKTIVIGQFFSRMDVADGNLDLVGSQQAVGSEAVIHVARMIPAKEVGTIASAIAEMVKRGCQGPGESGMRTGVDDLIEGIAHPRDRSPW